MNHKRQMEERYFVEEVGMYFEQTGLPRMAGRILGRLIISDPPHQSPSGLAEALLASKGSISTMTRLLTEIGLIERFSLPGVRRDYFRIRPGAWHHLLAQRLDQLRAWRQIAERALELVEGKAVLTREWLEEVRDMYAFFEQELPVLVERWEQKHKEKQATSQMTRRE